jgi:cytochrome b
MGVDVSTVRKRIARLEGVGLIQRRFRWGKYGGQETNFYDFTGLIAAATPFANEVIQEREQRKTEDAARRKRRGRKLELVQSQSSGRQP